MWGRALCPFAIVVKMAEVPVRKAAVEDTATQAYAIPEEACNSGNAVTSVSL